jgi:hypothetical protein
MNTAKVIFAHVFRCNIVRDVLKKINIIRSGVCNIILHAEIEYKRNNDLFYSLNVYKKRVIYHFANIIKTLTSRSPFWINKNR